MFASSRPLVVLVVVSKQPPSRAATSDTLRHRVNAMRTAKNTLAQARCTLCSARV